MIGHTTNRLPTLKTNMFTEFLYNIGNNYRSTMPLPTFSEVNYYWEKEIVEKNVTGNFTIDPSENPFKKYEFDLGLLTRDSQNFYRKYGTGNRITIVGMTDNHNFQLNAACRNAWNDTRKKIKFVGRYCGDKKFILEPPCSDVSYLEIMINDTHQILLDNPEQDVIMSILPDGTPVLDGPEEDRTL